MAIYSVYLLILRGQGNFIGGSWMNPLLPVTRLEPATIFFWEERTIKKILFWGFVVVFLLYSTFVIMTIYGKHQIEEHCKDVHFKSFYIYSFGYKPYEPKSQILFFVFEYDCKIFFTPVNCWSPFHGIFQVGLW